MYCAVERSKPRPVSEIEDAGGRLLTLTWQGSCALTWQRPYTLSWQVSFTLTCLTHLHVLHSYMVRVLQATQLRAWHCCGNLIVMFKLRDAFAREFVVQEDLTFSTEP